MSYKVRVWLFVLAVLVLLVPFTAADSISVNIISPEVAAPGDIISFDIIVTNLATVVLDHCNYFFSVGPYVDLIQDCFGNHIDEGRHISSLSDSLALPPFPGTNQYFGMPILGKIRHDAPAGSVITSSFSMDVISNEDPEGNWCPGCWTDGAGTSNFTSVQAGPVPAPEFPGMIVPGILLIGLIGLITLVKKHK